MPQKDKDARKEYNRLQYLKRKSSHNTANVIENNERAIESQVNDLNYYLLKFYKNIQKVNNEFLNVKLKPYHKPLNLETFKSSYDLVVCEIKNLDRVKYFIKYFHKVAFLYDKMFFHYKNPKRSGGCTNFYCVFGHMCVTGMKNHGDVLKYENVKKGMMTYHYKNLYQSNGIEILGMRPRYTKDNKYKYVNVSIKDLKNSCKINNLKGYNIMDKLDLVKLLMSI